MVFEEGVVHRP
ncbi:hypothetical protein CRUP_012550 [Coryphaenoides rupestris]|nr:hypothetical protein CRUP_012550 [Coryphaenoides rupestris]